MRAHFAPFLRFVALSILFFVWKSSSHAASQFAGFYTGTMNLAISGNVNMPERPIGPVAFTIDADGNVSSSGDLSGTVNDSGAITWILPNTGNFANGQITDTTLRSTGTLNHDGATSTYRVEARSSAPGLEGTSLFAGRLERVNPSTALHEMIRVRFLNGRFIAVGHHGAMAFSDDGETWSFTGLNTNADLIDVAYGNGTYLVIGFGGLTYTSPDGVTWTRRAPGGSTFGSSVAFGNGIFMLSSRGSAQTSTDGIAWQPASVSLPAASYGGVEFVGGNFVFDSGVTVAMTSNGKDLVASGNPGVGNTIIIESLRQHVAFGNGVYAVGGATGVAWSADGKTWTLGTGPTARIDAVFFANGKFVIYDAAKNVWTSTAGATWERVGYLSEGVRSIAYGNGRFVAVGPELYLSTDATTWLRPEVDMTRPNLTAVYAERTQQNPPKFYFHDQYWTPNPAYGPTSPAPVRGSLIDLSDVGRFWFGDDGYIFYQLGTWANGSGVAPRLTDRTLRAGAPVYQASYIAGDGGVMIRVTYPKSLQPPVFELHPSPTTSDILSGTSGIFVGANGTILKAAPNNITWNVVNSGTTATLRHVFFYSFGRVTPSDLYIAVGDNGTILTSPDGSAWTRRESGTTARLVGSSLGYFESPQKVFIAGEDGTLLESTNGLTWTPARRLPTSKKLNSFVFSPPFVMMGGGDNGEVMTDRGGGMFSAETTGEGTFRDGTLGNGRWLLVGNGLASISFDGRTWTTRRVPRELSSVAFGSGKFVAVGSQFTAISGDGLNWNIQAIANKLFNGVTYGGGKFVAVGGGAIFVSVDGQTWTEKSIPTANLSVVTYGNGRFVATGASSSATSNDGGVTWTSTGGALNQRAIAFGNGRFVSVGTEGRVAWSENGSNWSIRQLSGPTVLDGRPFFNDIVFVNGEFLATSNIGVIYRSSNGADWTHLYPGLTIDPDVAVFGNGRLLLAQNSEVFLVNMPDGGAPSVAQNPTAADFIEGGELTLSASFTGADIDLIWLRDGQPLANDARITGATTTTLRLAGLTLEDAGAYSLAANNASGSRVSASANVTVTARARITQQPQSIVLAAGADTTLTAAVTGGGLTYQWFRNGNLIPGATGASLPIDDATQATAGIYHLDVNNIAGLVRSNPVGVSVRSVAAGLALDSWLSVAFTGTRYVTGLAFDPDGKLYVSGYFGFPNPNGGNYDGLIRLNADGSVDGTFNPPIPDAEVGSFRFLPNGQILIGGYFEKLGAVTARGLARLNANGSRDSTFVPGLAPAYSGVLSMVPRADGKIIAGGAFTAFGGLNTIKYLGLLNADGTPDTTFVPSAIQNEVSSVALQSDGKIVIAGSFSSPASRVARLSAAGQFDSTFNAGQVGVGVGAASMILRSVTVAAGDKIYVAGRFGTYAGRPAVSLLRLNSNGTLDPSFNAGLNGAETPIPPTIENAVPFGDDVLFGGQFRSVHGNPAKQYLALVNSTGQLTDGLNLATGPNGQVTQLARAPGGSIIVAGNFTQVNGQPRVMLAKLSPQSGAAIPLAVFAPPASTRVPVGGLAVISVAASGHGSLNFQWRKGDQILSGQTTASLILSNVQLPDAGTYTVTVTDANGRINANVELAVGEDQPNGFAAFAASLPQGQRGENDDPDNDRLTNIAEYALGSNPVTADAVQRPTATRLQVEGQTYAAIVFTRNRKAAGVTIEVNASDTVTFTALAPTVESVEDLGAGIERVTVRSAQPLPTLPRFFLRVVARTE